MPHNFPPLAYLLDQTSKLLISPLDDEKFKDSLKTQNFNSYCTTRSISPEIDEERQSSNSVDEGFDDKNTTQSQLDPQQKVFDESCRSSIDEFRNIETPNPKFQIALEQQKAIYELKLDELSKSHQIDVQRLQKTTDSLNGQMIENQNSHHKQIKNLSNKYTERIHTLESLLAEKSDHLAQLTSNTQNQEKDFDLKISILEQQKELLEVQLEKSRDKVVEKQKIASEQKSEIESLKNLLNEQIEKNEILRRQSEEIQDAQMRHIEKLKVDLENEKILHKQNIDEINQQLQTNQSKLNRQEKLNDYLKKCIKILDSELERYSDQISAIESVVCEL